MTTPVRVTVWNEYRHEKQNPQIAAIYPQGIHGAIAGYLRGHGCARRT
jgi:trehalose utilization protein